MLFLFFLVCDRLLTSLQNEFSLSPSNNRTTPSIKVLAELMAASSWPCLPILQLGVDILILGQREWAEVVCVTPGHHLSHTCPEFCFLLSAGWKTVQLNQQPWTQRWKPHFGDGTIDLLVLSCTSGWPSYLLLDGFMRETNKLLFISATVFCDCSPID